MLLGLARLAQVASFSPPAGYGRKRNPSKSSFNAGYAYRSRTPIRPGHTLVNTDCNRIRLKAATKGSPKSCARACRTTPRVRHVPPEEGRPTYQGHSSRAPAPSLCTSTTTHCESPPFLRKPPACTAHTRPRGVDDGPDQSGDRWAEVYSSLHPCTSNHQRAQAEPGHNY